MDDSPESLIRFSGRFALMPENTLKQALTKLRALEAEIVRLKKIEYAHDHLLETCDLQRWKRLKDIETAYRQLMDPKYFNKLERLYNEQKAKIYGDRNRYREALQRQRNGAVS
ncbi:hypothetical protein [Mesorhizobium sp. CN2-181]|uniref:hypothetical protein n=1 Tax=Mesorhizobium yinganensis TaxID=3157707 RepID=UPI0032B7C042